MKTPSRRLNLLIGAVSVAIGLYVYLSEPSSNDSNTNSGATKGNNVLDLASVDLARVPDHFHEQATRLGNALSQIGFAYLVNVPGFDSDELLRATQWFFGLPNQTKYDCAKRAFKADNRNHYRGYFPLVKGNPSYKEAFEIGIFFDNPTTEDKLQQSGGRLLMRDLLTEGNTWPQSENREKDRYFQEIIERQYRVYANAAETTLRLLAHYWGLERDHFASSFGKDQLSTFRLLHYPDRRGDQNIPAVAKLQDGRLITTAAHHDSSVLTLLATFHYEGLQLDLNDDGNWQDVRTNKKPGLVVNTGRLLSLLSGGRIRATSHRVMDVGSSRFSVPFFYEENFDADVSRDIDGKQVEGIQPNGKYGPWMTNLTSQYAEYATTNWGIID